MLVGSLAVLWADDEGGPLGWVYFTALMSSLLWVGAASVSLLRLAVAADAALGRQPAPAA